MKDIEFLIADSYPDEAEQLKKELSGKYNVISVRDNGVGIHWMIL